MYHSEEAENQYMKDPKRAVLGDGNQPRDAKDYSNKSFRGEKRRGTRERESAIK